MANEYFRVNLRFRCFDQGWTETYYAFAATAKDATNFSDAKTVQNGILGMRNQQVFLDSIEARAEANPRNAYIRRFGQSRPDPASGSATVDVTAVSARVQFLSATAKRFAWIRGLPDSWTIRDQDTGKALPTANLVEAVKDWVKTIKGDYVGAGYTGPWPLMIRALNQSGVGIQAIRVTALAVNPTNAAVTDVTLASAFDLTTTAIRFTGLRSGYGLDGLSGVFQILARAGNVITIGYRLRSDLTTGLPPALTARTVAYRYEGITEGVIADLSTHDTGSPTNRRRGRRRRGQSRQ